MTDKSNPAEAPAEAPATAEAPAEAPATAEAPAEAPDGSGGSDGVTLSWPVAAGVATLLVVAIAAAVVFGWLYLAQGDDDSDQDEVLAAARSLAASVTSYDYQDIDQNIADVLDGATGKFREQYLGASTSLKDIIREAKAVAEGKVVDAAIQSLDGDNATVLLFVDQSVTNAARKKPQQDDNRLRMTLQRDNDRWLVSELELL